MLAELKAVTLLDVGILSFFDFFLLVEFVVLDFKDIVPDVGEIRVIEADVEKERGIEFLEKLEVPRSSVAVRAEHVLLALLLGQRPVWDSNIDLFLSATNGLHDLESLVSREYLIVRVYGRNLDEVEFGNTRLKICFLLGREGAGVLGVRHEVVDLALLRPPLQ